MKKFYWTKILIDSHYIIKEENGIINDKFYWGYQVNTYSRWWFTWKEEIRLLGCNFNGSPSVGNCTLEQAKANLQEFLNYKNFLPPPKKINKIVAKFDRAGKEKLESFS